MGPGTWLKVRAETCKKLVEPWNTANPLLLHTGRCHTNTLPLKKKMVCMTLAVKPSASTVQYVALSAETTTGYTISQAITYAITQVTIQYAVHNCNLQKSSHPLTLVKTTTII
jgi:hypothetical protein